jgi:hypothetical protein
MIPSRRIFDEHGGEYDRWFDDAMMLTRPRQKGKKLLIFQENYCPFCTSFLSGKCEIKKTEVKTVNGCCQHRHLFRMR